MDLLMDSPKTESWRELLKLVNDKEGWCDRVRALTQPKLRQVTTTTSKFSMTPPTVKRREETET